jgi:hypothetical protein
MGMRMIGSQEVEACSIIPQSNPLGEFMLVQGQGVAQVCPLSGDREEALRETPCKVKSGRSSHRLSMNEYEKRFFELLKYVDFIKDEKVKIQRFLSGLPSFYSDMIQYDNPKNFEETIRRERHLYEKRKGRPVFQKTWTEKLKGKREKRKKGFKPPFFKDNSHANHQVQSVQNENKTTNSFGKG